MCIHIYIYIYIVCVRRAYVRVCVVCVSVLHIFKRIVLLYETLREYCTMKLPFFNNLYRRNYLRRKYVGRIGN